MPTQENDFQSLIANTPSLVRKMSKMDRNPLRLYKMMSNSRANNGREIAIHMPAGKSINAEPNVRCNRYLLSLAEKSRMTKYFFNFFVLALWLLAEPKVFAGEAHWYDVAGISVGKKDFTQGVLGAEVTFFPVGQRIPIGLSIGKTQIRQREIYSEIEYLYKHFDRLLLVWTIGGGPMWYENKMSGVQMTTSFLITPLPCVYARLQKYDDERKNSVEIGLFFKFPVITTIFRKGRS